jgi:hypothetical protein
LEKLHWETGADREEGIDILPTRQFAQRLWSGRIIA